MLIRKLLWTLVPVIASKLLSKRRGSQSARADKTRYNRNRGR